VPLSEVVPPSDGLQTLIGRLGMIASGPQVSPACAHSVAEAQSWMGPIGVLGQEVITQLVVMLMLPQQTWPVAHIDAFVHTTPPESVAEPLLLPLPPPLLLAVPVSSPPSVAAAGAGLLLELQATANATAAALETDHKIIEFFILETSLLSLGEPQAACVSPSYAVSCPSPLSVKCRKCAS
jgi:hypothetical protein